MRVTGKDRRFLFLQGPHGPFFHQLGRLVRDSGAQVWRVGFNNGDRMFWPDKASFLPYGGALADWPAQVAEIFARHAITDLVLYGDTRPVHAQAIEAARTAGITVHVFEEGYLRPHWITYERGGTNGNSRLTQMSVAQMQQALARADIVAEQHKAPAHWGNIREHIFWGMVYHFFVLRGSKSFANYRPHRSLSVLQEFRLFLRLLCLLPVHRGERILAQRKIRRGGFPYHLVLLQLEHDASMQAHSPFSSGVEFLSTVFEGFVAGAPSHHHLVFKAHPLEDGRAPIRRKILDLAEQYGIGARVHFVRGGKLAMLLDHARSAVTVNSTAAQQALWRGLPLKIFGTAIYDKPEFVSTQSLPEFFARPMRPDMQAYRLFRHYLLETSQVTGGFYSASARRRLLRQVVDMMLTGDDPYDALLYGRAMPREPLRAKESAAD